MIKKTERSILTNSYALEMKIEDLNILADIVMQAGQHKVLHETEDGLRTIIHKALLHASSCLWGQHHYDFSTSLPGISERTNFTKGNIDNYLFNWIKALRTDPCNAYIHSQISRILNTKKDGDQLFRLTAIQRRFYLHYIKTFGHSYLNSPFDILYEKNTDSLWVSDPPSGKIVLFDINGHRLHELDIGLKSPMGLFKNDKDSLWICDFSKSKISLISTASQAFNILGEISFKEVASHCYPYTHPRFGACFENHIVIILMDSSGIGRRLMAMHRFHPYDIHSVLPTLNAHTPIGIKAWNMSLYIGNFDPPYIYEVSSLRNHPSQCIRQPLPGKVRRFIRTTDAFYISTGPCLVKTSAHGYIEYVFNLNKFFHTNGACARGLDLVKYNQRELLFIADEGQSAVHCFAISPPPL